jgi:hypothetical protein
LRNATSTHSVLQLNRYLYLLENSQIKQKHEFEGNVKFALMQNLNFKVKNMIAIMHEADKLVKFYDWNDFVTGDLSAPLYQYKNWKKLVTILDISVPNIQGLLIGDKVGEIYFLNVNNLEKLPKNVEEVPGKNQEEAQEFDFVAKVLYGHQQTVTSLQKCREYLISLDTLNKVVVNNFPNMFNLQSVNTDQRR